MLDCALPHQDEVFATFDYTGAKEYPGARAARGPGQVVVPDVVGGLRGRTLRDLALEIGFDLPDESGWGNGIRHVVGCLVVDPTGRARSPARPRAVAQ